MGLAASAFTAKRIVDHVWAFAHQIYRDIVGRIIPNGENNPTLARADYLNPGITLAKATHHKV